MGEEVNDWINFYGARIQQPCDMPDDILKDAILSTQELMEEFPDFDVHGSRIAETLKNDFDTKWGPHWHVIMGRNFGSFVTHETRHFVFFYIGDKAVMMYKAG